jgi:hypothetical protein
MASTNEPKVEENAGGGMNKSQSTASLPMFVPSSAQQTDVSTISCCVNVSMCQCVDVSMCQCANVPMCKFVNICLYFKLESTLPEAIDCHILSMSSC